MRGYFVSTIRRIGNLFVPTFLRPGAKYSLSLFRADCIAGFTVAVILVPQGMALALIAGLPAAYGLYAALPGFIASLWGSSRHLSTGPVAIVSFLTFSSLLPLATPGSIEFITLAAALALLVGIIQLLMGVFRLGFVMQLIPHSAIAGFISAAAAIIVITQIPTLLGFDISQHEFIFLNIFEIVISLHTLSPETLVIGATALGLLIVFRRLPRTFPSTLVVLGLGILASYFGHLANYGVELVQSIPSALPTFAFPAIGATALLSLLPKAAIIAFVGFVEAHAIGKSVATTTRESINTNQELVGQGLANIVGGLFRGYPVSGSFLRTAVNVEAGAKTGIAAVVTTVVTVFVLLFLAPVLELLPRAILAAIVIISALSLIDLASLRNTYTSFRTDGIVAYVTFAMAFILKPDDAIFIGTLLALILFIRHTVWGVQIIEMGIDRKWNILRTVSDSERVYALKQTLILRPGMSIYYANAEHIANKIRVMAAQRRSEEELNRIVIDFSGINFVDSTGAEVLAELMQDFERSGLSVATLYLRGVVRQSLVAIPHFPDITILHNIAEMREFSAHTEDGTVHRAATKPDTLRGVTYQLADETSSNS